MYYNVSDRRRGEFCTIKGKRLSGSPAAMYENVDRLWSCGLLCVRRYCVQFNYHWTLKSCELFDYDVRSVEKGYELVRGYMLVDAPGWMTQQRIL